MYILRVTYTLLRRVLLKIIREKKTHFIHSVLWISIDSIVNEIKAYAMPEQYHYKTITRIVYVYKYGFVRIDRSV